MNDRPGEVHIRPTEPEQLTLTEPHAEGDGEKRFEAVTFDRFEEDLHFLGRHHTDRRPLRPGGIHERGDVPSHEVPP